MALHQPHHQRRGSTRTTPNRSGATSRPGSPGLYRCCSCLTERERTAAQRQSTQSRHLTAPIQVSFHQDHHYHTPQLKTSPRPHTDCSWRGQTAMHFSANLSWSTHINYITKRANSTLGFLRHCPTACKRKAYLALVRPLLEY